ncbi:hypothetical protein NFIA_035720 [Paecilomyces variotii No. 5]|uniref:Calcineurin-like phosphoesterase domain-containing protein n=1 Tax=Byssochlamys spectabilis (strain No. 5 / NBRC 109023) TaxID=1356009 RepID=V5FNB4_BYSSN|nr:hypothetical protein NFIA_035720 [Paecilomyces variotii No. 5]
MFLRTLLSRALIILLPLSIASTIYLYLYPVFHGCAFPLPSREARPSSPWSNGFVNTLLRHVAPGHAAAQEPAVFRLLVLADPQLEGDSSLPGPEDEFFPRLVRHWGSIKAAAVGNVSSSESEQDPELESESEALPVTAIEAVQNALRTIVLEDIPDALRAARKRLDLFGNDYYLAHIYRTLHWWSRPTHVTVLGDLIGSQWVTDEEFETRGWRYWNRVFAGGERVDDEITITGQKGYSNGPETEDHVPLLPTLKRYNSSWEHKIINIAGNHDIGYAGDVSEARLERFERVFGRANWDIRFQHPLDGVNADQSTTEIPTLHIINLNDLTLDVPPLSQDIQTWSYDYINDVISHRSRPVEDRNSFTLLLTHVPLHKREGVCTDAPYFSFHESDDEDGDDGIPRYREGGLKEQNHLSDHASASGILQGIFGMSGDQNVPAGGRGRNGLILNGHDHTGCDVVHFVNRSIEAENETNEGEEAAAPTVSWKWDATRYENSAPITEDQEMPSIREVTLRAMMGEYGGNAGLLSVWFDFDPAVNEWKYDIIMCKAGVQHIWWAVHGVGIATFVVMFVWTLLSFVEVVLSARRDEKKPTKGHTAMDGAKHVRNVSPKTVQEEKGKI